MIYILCAFEVEARALIDKHRLQKGRSGPYKIFSNEEILVFISGMGQDNAKDAVQNMLLNFPNTSTDIFINLGICAAQTPYEIGELLQVKKLKDDEESHLLKTVDSQLPTVSCFSSKVPLSRPVNEDIAEMEAMSLYRGVNEYFQAGNISILKIVSDHFDPSKIDKPFIISLIQKNLSKIDRHINTMREAL